MNELTIILPFLNEKEEVQHTLDSIFSHLGERKVDVILINDASDDGYEYDRLLEKYKVQYIRNQTRQGVAKCRELGVSRCKTPYFLLLDAHMRFYSDTWADVILNYLESHDRVLLCCQNRILEKVDNKLVDRGIQTLGAYVDMVTYDPTWITSSSPESSEAFIPIPCVLGAAYATRKKYWEYLKGLDGLLLFGLDESFISLKVGIEGGKCILLKDVVVGHIYRKKAPYPMSPSTMIFNKIMISELLLPISSKLEHFKNLGQAIRYKKEVVAMLDSHKKKILMHMGYFANIGNRNKFEVIKTHYYHIPSITNTSLQKTADKILNEPTLLQEIGLLNGKLGGILFLITYAGFSKIERYTTLSGLLLNEVIDRINEDVKGIGFSRGLAGIGWGLQYLQIHHLLEGDIDDLLVQIDRLVLDFLFSGSNDYSFETGINGALYYILSRLRYRYLIGSEPTFSDSVLLRLAALAQAILSGPTYVQVSVIPVCMLKYVENKNWIMDVFDIRELILPSTLYITDESMDLSLLTGLSGKGLLALQNGLVS